MEILIKFIFVISFLSFGVVEVCSDLHSSIPAREKAFSTEKIFIKKLRNYLVGADKKLGHLKRKLQTLKEIGLTENNTNTEISFFKKLTEGLNQHLMAIGFWNNGLEYQSKPIISYQVPTRADFEAATDSIVRIQDIYLYKAKEIASGNFLKVKNKSKLKSFDCFEIGHHYLRNFNFTHRAEEWFQEAYDIFQKNKEEKEGWSSITLGHLFRYLGYYHSLRGDEQNLKQAIYFAKKSLEMNSAQENLAEELASYEQNLKRKKISQKINIKEETETYHKGCRGELQKTPEEIRKLYCKYESENHPFLKLAPLKVEIHNWEPLLAVYYDILYDSEIEVIETIAKQKLRPAGVWNATGNRVEYTKHRASQLIFIHVDAHPVMKTIDQRLVDMSGLSVETAEALQVVNYGSGGYYNVHSDYFADLPETGDVEPYFQNFADGNRVATILFYMSDVQGGATVFPNMKTAIFPKKGSAAFWYNLHPNGKGDHRSRHAACPVVFGSKWVCNKWFRIRGQEFLRPCKKNELDS